MTTPNTPPSTEPDQSTAPDTSTTTDGTASDSRDSSETSLKNEMAKYRRQAKEAQTELDKLRAATATDAEKAVAAARAEGAAEYATKWRSAVLQNAALSALTDRGVEAPGLAVRALDLEGVDIDDHGKVDDAALTAAIENLLRRWPQLAPRGAPPLPTVSGDTQTRVTKDQVVKKDMTDQDVDQLLRYALRSNS